MNSKPYCAISSLVFTVVAIAHAVRALRGLPLVVGAWQVPVSASWLATVIGILLAIWGLRLASRP
jgi:hypothetical protein